jgi:DHA1 family tetracycline resistance protein-like MFS transporter
MEETPISALQPAPPLPSPTPTEPSSPVDAAGHRRAIFIVFLVVFIDLLGFGIVLPLLPQYAKSFLREHVSRQAEGAIIGVIYVVFSLMQFTFAPIWGRVSDRVGRRPILLLGLVGSVIFYALFGLGSELGAESWVLALVVLFVARAGAGVAGATIATAQAVIADSTTPERRSRGMALIGAAFGIGFTFGPLIAAASFYFWPNSLGAPAFAASALSLVALLLGIRLLPETVTAHPKSIHRAWLDWSSLKRALQMPTIGTLVLAFFMATFAFANFEGTLALFLEDRLHYSTVHVMYGFAYVGFMLMVAQGGVYRPLAKKGVSELTFMKLGLVLMMVGLAGLALVSIVAGWPDYLSDAGLLTIILIDLAVAVFGFAFLTPSVQALISRRSDPARQGEILGVNQSASALARILGPLVGLSLVSLWPPYVLPYCLAALLLLVVLLMVPRLGAGEPGA